MSSRPLGGRLIRDGQVAVLVSHGFGAGWSSWLDEEVAREAIFDPVIASAIDAGFSPEHIRAIAYERYPDQHLGGLEGLTVEWVPQGTRFIIEEYDGSESIRFYDSVEWETA